MALALMLALVIATPTSAHVASDVTPAVIASSSATNDSMKSVASDWFNVGTANCETTITSMVPAANMDEMATAQTATTAAITTTGSARAPSNVSATTANFSLYTAPVNANSVKGWTAQLASEIVEYSTTSNIAANANRGYDATPARCEDWRAVNSKDLARTATTA